MHRDHHREDPAADDRAGTLVAEHANEPTTVALLRAIAAMEGVPEHDLDPLYETIDPAAMEQLMAHSDRHDCDVTVEFTYEGYVVRVRNGGDVRIVAEA
ncbi:hypothetical protein CP556_08260 [Natrinema sp. CBA1119]|uniref:HalOD1 output domain-containing protein n=1 Tax=Natrinema sp. CBA1119 TaxID=1608465 RepID=UPI000BF61FD2|nr:HalOD1 output domain-containing protein [Natrinema sp. CBA1119]PGF16111.1 hypothetical protein CP556_08260 [Natrinema sp. CBA1119]